MVIEAVIYLIPNEAAIGQFFVARFTAKALWMPAGRHRFDYTADNKFTAFITARCKQHVKVTFAVFASLKLIENTILKWPEALSAAVFWGFFGEQN